MQLSFFIVFPFQPVPVVCLLGLMKKRPETHRLTVQLDFFESCCTAIGFYEVRLSNLKFLCFILSKDTAQISS